MKECEGETVGWLGEKTLRLSASRLCASLKKPGERGRAMKKVEKRAMSLDRDGAMKGGALLARRAQENRWSFLGTDNEGSNRQRR